MGLSLSVKKALTGELAPPYRQADKKKKTTLLDGCIQPTDSNRTYALHLLTHWGKETFRTVEGTPVKLKAGTAKRRRGEEGNPGTGLR
jgi:hypothetical protein